MSYSHSQGAFAGISFEGSVFTSRAADNKEFYGREVTAREILSGSVVCPKNQTLSKIYEVLDQLTNGEEISKNEFKKYKHYGTVEAKLRPKINIYGKSLEERVTEELNISSLPPAEKASARKQSRIQRMVCVEEIFRSEELQRIQNKKERHDQLQKVKRVRM